MSFYGKYAHWAIGAAMVALTTGLGYFTEQRGFPKIIACYAPLFLFYLLAFHHSRPPQIPPQPNNQPPTIKFYLGLAILLRFILVFSVPNLSNDVYRFIWDGRLLVQGYNPFDHLPLYYLEAQNQVPGIDRALFEAFGAKNFFTVYPPLAQLQFGSACWLFPNDVFWCIVVMKTWLFAYEIGSIWLIVQLLKHFKLPARNVLLYALNPLIILEITGNLHFEGAMIFFLLLSLWLLVKGDGLSSKLRFFASAAAFAFSIGSKLLTVLFLPFFIKKMGTGKGLRYFAATGIATALLFLPIVNGTFIGNFGSSLNLYFQKLEFNASLYYVLRWLYFQISGYNQIAVIGPALGGVALVGILVMAFKPRHPAPNWGWLIQGWLFAICLYLVCTTTLHPWYLALPIVLCVFTPYRFPIVWSGLVFLTYVNYSYQPYEENLWVVGIEYAAVLAWFVLEWRAMGKKAFSEFSGLRN